MRLRPHPPEALARRVMPLAILAGLLTAALLVSSASADSTGNVVLDAYIAGGGHIASCAFTKSQLTSLRTQLGPDTDDYAPDLRAELDREIARWTSGACGPSGGGTSGEASYRATIKSLKVSKSRRSVRVRMRCPAKALASCKVKLSGRLAGKKAAKNRSATVKVGKTKTVTVKLRKAARTRLREKGGRLKITAKTTGSTLAASKRSVKIARPA